ncbi:MAG: hypothetical protein LPH21_16190 [Shewanella sp.]|nr:hypothetical protein [Shewanella sp.]
MNGPANGNILIKETNEGTIKAVAQHLEWLCLACEADGDTHPGLQQSLQLLRIAVKSVVDTNEGLIKPTQKV